MIYIIFILSCVFLGLGMWLKPPLVQKKGGLKPVMFYTSSFIFLTLALLVLYDWYYISEQVHFVLLSASFLISLFLIPHRYSQNRVILKIRLRLLTTMSIITFLILIFNIRNSAFTAFNGKVFHDDGGYVLVKQAWTDPNKKPERWYIYPDVYRRNRIGMIKKLTNNSKIKIPHEFYVEVIWREVHIEVKFKLHWNNSTIFYYGLGK